MSDDSNRFISRLLGTRTRYPVTLRPEGSARARRVKGESLSSLTLSVSTFEAVSSRSETVTAGRNSEVESGAKILPGNPLLAGTPRILDCQAGLAELRPHKTSALTTPQKGGAPDFLCRLNTTVPVR
jgi:hypothetical protein